MHLKTILIFCSFCFFTGIISVGLNVRQIDLFEKLIISYKYGDNINLIQHALLCHDIEETYNDYNVDDEKTVRIFKILNFLVKVNKTSDNKKVEKLGINEVQLISNKFSNLDTDNDCLIDKEQFITLIDYYVSTVNITINLFKNIHNYLHTRYIVQDFFSLPKNNRAHSDFEKITNKIIKIYAHEL
ncbi:uncharacterized protein LOC126909539 [Daktulosphaira vitifoliae]|uniref:uncharacterized protein LOC126909539 n=1 Tax=Daktulosphaira vitifoliae TaxID=58002 RepID=UPI0021A9A4A3|nr:uncharacterized protein LOC126909539 [Daktulosphaira vitifoliae]